MTDIDYQTRTDHFRHCPGAPEAEEWQQTQRDLQQRLGQMGNGLPWRTQTNAAWIVCLHRADVIDRETARKLLGAIYEVLEDGQPGGGTESSIVEKLGDEDLGSIMNYGRTLQEPMSRLQMRAMMLDVFETIHELMATVLGVAEENVDTVMAGHTHFSHGQPITFAHYLLAVFDAIQRGEEQFQLAYKHTNRNTGGCGSTSGTTWPVDRRLLTKLLGFDELVEPTYDCESSQDHSMSIMFALSNIALLITKVAMDLEIWTLEEFDIFDVEPGYRGQSSFMPHKAHPGSRLERTRVPAAEVLGETVKGMYLSKGEPHQDVIPMVAIPQGPAPKVMAYAQVAMRNLGGFLAHCDPKKDRMLQYVREGFSCSTEVVVHMVKHLGYGGRRAHRIAATFVRLCRERGVKANEATGGLLDEAADLVGQPPPRIETATLRRLLDPVEFIKTHNNVGGVAPEEAKRMLAERRKLMEDLSHLQNRRKERIGNGEELLQTEVDRITAEDCF